MGDRIRRFETFSFLDKKGICDHLEKMAAEGWMIEKMTMFGWVYHRITPKKINFGISYFSEISKGELGLSDGQKNFLEMCEHIGWKLVHIWNTMYIFYNENENPIPLETEPEIEVENIKRAAKTNILFMDIFGILVFGEDVVRYIWDWIKNGSIEAVSLLLLILFSIMLIQDTAELICYGIWYGKAKKAAEQGEFIEPIGITKLNQINRILFTIAFIAWIVSSV